MIQQPRLPYVQFRVEAQEVKDEGGHISFVNKYWADVVPAGGKDVVVKDAAEWIAELRRKCETRGPFDSNASEYRAWHEHFSKAFEQFKAGEEMTTTGTPLRALLAFTKAEIAQAESIRIYSLEDLAASNEEALRHMGIGARAMKDKAVQLLASRGENHQAEELAAAHARIEQLEARIEQFIAAGGELKRGPKRKEPEIAE